MKEDVWLAARLGLPCFTVEDADPAGQLGQAGFHQAKVPSTDVGRVGELERAGFRVVDVNVTLRRDPGAIACREGVEVRDARPEDHDSVLDIAADHYDVSRFHRDPLVEPAAASAIKRDWAAAVLAGDRGERMLVARRDETVVGFLAVVATERARVIDLVAVHSEARGTGAGRALVARLLADSDRPVEVGTQIDTRFVLHRHTP